MRMCVDQAGEQWCTAAINFTKSFLSGSALPEVVNDAVLDQQPPTKHTICRAGIGYDDGVFKKKIFLQAVPLFR